MHRVLPLAVAVSAAVSLAACGSTTSSSSPTTATPGGAATTGGSGTSSSVSTGNPSAPVTISESGSSLLDPFLAELVAPLKAMYPNVTLAPAAGGSGKGITDALSGNTQAGGTDAYLSPSELSANPDAENVPIAVSSQSVDYNLAGVSNLKLSGSVLAQIYMGTVTKWNDPAIAALNPGVTLPSETIVPIHRVDASGDTFLFTSFLSKTSPAWANGPSMNTSVTWPAVSGELTAQGNPGMVSACKSAPGCIAYIGISSQKTAAADGLGQAELQNAAGQFTLPNPTSITAAVQQGAGNVPDNLVESFIDEPGASSYPIVNLEYIVVKTSQSSATTAEALRDFLSFAISPTGGAAPSLLMAEDFQAIPTQIVSKVDAAIAKIQG